MRSEILVDKYGEIIFTQESRRVIRVDNTSTILGTIGTLYMTDTGRIISEDYV